MTRKQFTPVTISLSPDGARAGLRALADVHGMLNWPSIRKLWPQLYARVNGPLRLLALLLERSLDEAGEPRALSPSQLASLYKIRHSKIRK